MKKLGGRRVVGALGLIFSLIVITLLGLHYHIRTIGINSEVSQLKQDLKLLKRNNRRMQVQLLNATSLEVVEARAKKMGLEPTTRIRYLHHNPISTQDNLQ
ncbi:MAG: hypothetical protein O3A01_00350 [bacterium]|nr:hypothetical protein [bacterium]